MKVPIRLFARAKDLAGAEAVDYDLSGGVTAGEVRQRLVADFPRLAGLLEKSALAVNGEFADDDVVIPPNSEIALLPPVSGG